MVYAGIDIFVLPPADETKRLYEETNLEWFGYYLSPLSANRFPTFQPPAALDRLRNQGWGLAPIYFGVQVTGGMAELSGERGLKDGKLAAETARKTGFPIGSRIYLDVEEPSHVIFETAKSSPQLDYIGGWIRSLGLHGYMPGLYASVNIARKLKHTYPTAPVWAVRYTTAEKSTFDSPFPEETREPRNSGYPHALAWQYAGDVFIRVGGERLPKGMWVDLNTAYVRDPSKYTLLPGATLGLSPQA